MCGGPSRDPMTSLAVARVSTFLVVTLALARGVGGRAPTKRVGPKKITDEKLAAVWAAEYDVQCQQVQTQFMTSLWNYYVDISDQTKELFVSNSTSNTIILLLLLKSSN